MAKTKKNPVWEYTAQDRATGHVVEGKTSAPDEDLVRRALVERNLIPLNVVESGGSGLNTEISFKIGGGVKQRDIAIWARQFSIMVNAGLPVMRALTVLSAQTEKESMRDITIDIRDNIENGRSLQEAMAEHVDIFGDLIVNMVGAGEAGGFLDQTLMQIANDLEASVRLRAKVKSAMTYPAVILGLAAVMTTGMILFIVPVFAGMFESLGGDLPLPTKILVMLSDFLKVAIIPLIALGIAAVFWWKKNKRRDSIRRIVDPLKLKMPVFGGLITKIIISRFSRNLGTLVGAGVPLLRSLEITSGTVGNILFEDALRRVSDSVSQGELMSTPLQDEDRFPPMVTQMINVGEDAGNVEEMLAKVSEDYDQQVETMTEQLASLIEPLLIVVLGTVIGGLIVALYLPIFKVFDLISQSG